MDGCELWGLDKFSSLLEMPFRPGVRWTDIVVSEQLTWLTMLFTMILATFLKVFRSTPSRVVQPIAGILSTESPPHQLQPKRLQQANDQDMTLPKRSLPITSTGLVLLS